MNCGEFERAWQGRLDQPVGEVEEDLARHAAGCSACARRHAGYLALVSALVGRPSPLEAIPGPGFADRVLAEVASSPVALPIGRGLVRLAMAAGVLLAIGLAWNVSRKVGQDPPPIVRPDEPRPLSEAVAEFTSASLTLARETSAPAARLGLDALSGPESADSPDGEGSLQQLGTRLGEEMAPLRGSTRRAFSFLLGPGQAPIDAG